MLSNFHPAYHHNVTLHLHGSLKYNVRSPPRFLPLPTTRIFSLRLRISHKAARSSTLAICAWKTPASPKIAAKTGYFVVSLPIPVKL